MLQSKAFQNVVENTARLAGAHHVDVNVVKDCWVFRERIGEGRAAFDVFDNAAEYRFERFAVGMLILRR